MRTTEHIKEKGEPDMTTQTTTYPEILAMENMLREISAFDPKTQNRMFDWLLSRVNSDNKKKEQYGDENLLRGMPFQKKDRIDNTHTIGDKHD